MSRRLRTKRRSDQHWVDTLFEKGRVLLSQGRLNEAIAAWQKVAKLVPGDAAAHCNLGGLYLSCITIWKGKIQETKRPAVLMFRSDNRLFFSGKPVN